MKKTEHPYDLLQKGRKYDTLKKKYDELKILSDNVLEQRLKAETQRDEVVEALKTETVFLNNLMIDINQTVNIPANTKVWLESRIRSRGRELVKKQFKALKNNSK